MVETLGESAIQRLAPIDKANDVSVPFSLRVRPSVLDRGEEFPQPC
jgi:hypothetical protein